MTYPSFKRVIDVVVSFVLIVLLAPVWVLAATAVKLTSPGPVFFVQTRGGRDGKPFRSPKFRTMRAAHVHDPGVLARPHEDVRAVRGQHAQQLLGVLVRAVLRPHEREHGELERVRLAAQPVADAVVLRVG